MTVGYMHADEEGDILNIGTGSNGRRGITTNGMRGVYLPTDPADLHELVEAIYDRKIAKIVFEDEPTMGDIATRWAELGALINRYVESGRKLFSPTGELLDRDEKRWAIARALAHDAASVGDEKFSTLTASAQQYWLGQAEAALKVIEETT